MRTFTHLDAMRKLKIAGASLNQTPINWSNNLNNIQYAIDEAKKQQVDLLCLPELCVTGYGCEDLFLSDWLPEKALEQLNQVRILCKNITVSVGLPIEFNNKIFNCAAVIKDQQILGISAKQNLANEGVHYEHRWFTPWPKHSIEEININGQTTQIGDIIYNINGVTIGFEICEDAWIDDRPACRLIERGVELILNPSASHFAFGKAKQRHELIAKSSGKFNCVYLYTNLLGNEAGRMIYDGEILIGQKGKLIAENQRLSYKDINLLCAEVDFDTHNNTAITPTEVSKEQEFTDAVSLALFDYLRKSRSHGFVLSLSGGADSSTCAALVNAMVKRGVDELGVELFLSKIEKKSIASEIDKNNLIKSITRHLLTCAYQGTKNSSNDTFQAAKTLAESIGAQFHHWTIDDEVTSYSHKIENALGRQLDWKTDDIALQNIQARSRSPIIWMLANIKGALLLTTSNRSEGDVGYATMDGDTSGSIAPISAVDKPFIRQWLKWAEEELGMLGLQAVNELTPTAELRPASSNQTDEDDLMPYNTLLEIEKLAIGQRLSPLEVFENMNTGNKPKLKEHIVKFFRLWSRNQWKRERTAPAFHLDDFNVDPKTWCRFPILSGGYEEEIKELLK